MRSVLLVGLAVFALAATGCVQLVNAPSGGGSVVTSSYELGPFNLAAMGQPGSESNASAANIPRPAGAFGLVGARFDLVDENGDPIARHMVHLHHVLLMDNAHTDVLCPGRAERFSGSGMERTPLSLPSPYAYLVGQNDQWSSLWHIMNMSDMPMTVYIKYTLDYQPNANASNTRGVTPYFMDVTGCGNSEFDVPGTGGPGSVFTKSKTWNAPTNAVAVFAGGHVHAGGIDIRLSDPNSGLSCLMTAKYMASMPPTSTDVGMLDSIPSCTMHNLVAQGKPYTVTARYRNDLPVPGAMGIVLAYAWTGTQ